MQENKKKIPLTYANFSACGVLNVSGKTPNEKEESLLKLFQINGGNEGNFYSQLTLSLNCGKDRLSFAKLKGYASQGVERGFWVHSKDNFTQGFWAQYEERFDDKILDTISPNDYILVGLERATYANGEPYTIYRRFLSAYEAVNYIYEHLQDKMELKVSGKIEYSIGVNGVIYENKMINRIYLVNDTTKQDHYCTFSERVLCTSATFANAEENGYYTLPVYSNINVRNAETKAYETLAIPHNVYVSAVELPKWENIKKAFFNISSPTQVWVVDILGHYSYSVETQAVDIEDYLDAEKYPQWVQLIQGYELGLIQRSELERVISSNKATEYKLFSRVKLIKNPQGEGEIMSIDKDKLSLGDLTIVDLDAKKIVNSNATPTTSFATNITNNDVANAFKPKSPFAKTAPSRVTSSQKPTKAPRNLGEQEVNDSDYMEFMAAFGNTK